VAVPRAAWPAEKREADPSPRQKRGIRDDTRRGMDLKQDVNRAFRGVKPVRKRGGQECPDPLL